MIKKTAIGIAAMSSLSSPLPAFAHAGSHNDLHHLGEAFDHLLHSPFHLAAVAAGAMILGVIVWKAATKR